MRKLAGGVYVDSDNALHIVMKELLEANGYEDTPHNREMLLAAAQEVFGPLNVPVEQAP
jgi:hypothetical protein